MSYARDWDPMEWWLWHKLKRGTHTLSISFVRSLTLDVDYRWRISFRDHGAAETWEQLQQREKDRFCHDNNTLLTKACGSMATFMTHDRERHRDVIHTQMVITPPIFRIDTVIRDTAAFPVWFQPWLHHAGKRGIFHSYPYDHAIGYRSLDLSAIEELPSYESGDVRDRIAVAVDAFLQRGEPDVRFQDGQQEGEG